MNRMESSSAKMPFCTSSMSKRCRNWLNETPSGRSMLRLTASMPCRASSSRPLSNSMPRVWLTFLLVRLI